MTDDSLGIEDLDAPASTSRTKASTLDSIGVRAEERRERDARVRLSRPKAKSKKRVFGGMTAEAFDAEVAALAHRMTDAAVARKLGVSKFTVSDSRKRSGTRPFRLRIAEERSAAIAALVQRGWSVPDAAKQLGITGAGAYALLRKSSVRHLKKGPFAACGIFRTSLVEDRGEVTCGRCLQLTGENAKRFHVLNWSTPKLRDLRAAIDAEVARRGELP